MILHSPKVSYFGVYFEHYIHLREKRIMRILIIEDEKAIGNRINSTLTEHGYSSVLANKGREGLELAMIDSFDCIILDLRLPDMNGLDICKELRLKSIDTAVIILTALAEIEQIVDGLNAGADDYITKPFSSEELLARIYAVIRRKTFQQKGSIELSGVELNPIKRKVKVDGNSVLLSNREFLILQYLMHRRGEALTRTQIFEHVWEESLDLESNIVDVYINYVRKKIDTDGNKPSHIETVRGYGYRFSDNI